MSNIKSLEIPLTIASLCFVIALLEYYLNIPGLTALLETLTAMQTMILAFTIFTGTIFFGRFHLNKVQKREGRWPLSIWVLIILVTQTLLGIEPYIRTGDPGMIGTNPSYLWLYNIIQMPLDITLSSIYVLLIVYGLFKAIRIKSKESWFFVIPMFLILLTNAPIGATLFPPIPIFGQWFMDNVMIGGVRGVNIAVAFGVMLLGLRVLLRRERTAVGGGLE